MIKRLLTTVFILFVTTRPVQADFVNPFAVPVNFPAVQVQGLATYQGQFLTVMYASGQMAGLATSVDHMHLRSINTELTNLPINADSISLAAIQVMWSGFLKPNMLVFVVHSAPDFTWQNIDGAQPKLPSGLLPTANSQATAVSAVGLQKLLTEVTASDNTAYFLFNLSLPINTLQILPDGNQDSH